MAPGPAIAGSVAAVAVARLAAVVGRHSLAAYNHRNRHNSAAAVAAAVPVGSVPSSLFPTRRSASSPSKASAVC